MNRSIATALCLALAACGEGEISCGSPPDAAGTWTYTGDQSSPTATLAGGLTLTSTGTCTLQGSASLTIDQGAGSPATYSGPASAIFDDENSLELTLRVQGERLHVGEWHGDTISGTWSEVSGSGSSGNFRLVRAGGG